jgi:hypothetical protein
MFLQCPRFVGKGKPLVCKDGILNRIDGDSVTFAALVDLPLQLGISTYTKERQKERETIGISSQVIQHLAFGNRSTSKTLC